MDVSDAWSDFGKCFREFDKLYLRSDHPTRPSTMQKNQYVYSGGVTPCPLK